MSDAGKINFGQGAGSLLNQAQKAADSKEYLVEGVKLFCVNGSNITQLKLPTGHGYTSGGKKKVNCKDCKACENIPYFGECRKNEKDHKCEGFMDLVDKWENTAVGTGKAETVGGEEAISMSSVLLCKKGGVIIPVSSGQGYDGKINWAAFLKRYQNVFRWVAGKNMLCQVYGKDPINMNTGNYIYEKEDLIINGNMPLSFQLFYNAMDCGDQQVLGEGWNHNYGVRLIKIKEEELLGIVLEDGRELPYCRKLGDSYAPVMGDGEILSKSENGYQFERENGTVYEFDQEGKLYSQKDRIGNKRKFTYNSDGLLECVDNGTGGKLNYTYNKERKLIYVEDHTGRKISLRYQYGKLRWFTNSMGYTYTYEYNENGKVNGIITPRDILGVENEYDGVDRVRKQIMPDGGVTEFRYDDENSRTYMLEQNGNLVIYECDKLMRNVRTIYEDGEEIFEYNDRNQKVRYVDKSGNITRYSYDNRSNLTQVIDALGQKINMTYDSNGNLISIKQADGTYIKRHYYKRGNLIELVDANENSTKIDYNEKAMPSTIVLPDRSEISMKYDEKGNMVLLRGPLGNQISYEYDELNRIIKYTNANGNITRYRYDSKDNICEIENALGNKRTFYYEGDLLTKIIDYNGAINEFVYNKMNRVSQYINANGDIWFYEYDLMGNLIKEVRPDQGVVQYKYNKLNLLECVINPCGGKIKYKYDPNGNIIEFVNAIGGKSLFSYDALNRLISEKDADGNLTQYSYNKVGKISEIIDGLNRIVKYEYDNCGNLIKKIDSLGKESHFTYNSLNILSEVSNSVGEKINFSYYSGGLLDRITYLNGKILKYNYDYEENIIGLENENGYKITYDYDKLNQVVRINTNEGAENNIAYDAVGNIISIIDANRNKTEYRYSTTGDIVQVIDPSGNSTKYSYDYYGNITDMLVCENKDLNLMEIDLEEAINMKLHFNKYERNQMGQIIKSINASGESDLFEYDNAGNLIRRRDREGYQTRLSYTGDGNLQSIVYDDGREINYTYNPIKQLTEVKDWLGITKLNYDNFGRLESITDHKGRKIGYCWDDLGLQKAINYPNGDSINYYYNQNKEIIKLVSPMGSVQYSYDENGRLVKKDYSNRTNALYQYDSQNRLTSLSYYDSNEVLDKYEYDYDLKGNKTKVKKYRKNFPEESGTFVYGYDELDRLVDVTQDNRSICLYKYDSYGNVVCKDEAGVETRYLYDSTNKLIEERQAEKVKKYTYDPRGNLSTIKEGQNLVQTYLFGTTNRLEQCSNAVGKAIYQYNGLGIRVAKTEESKANSIKHIEYVTDQTKMYNNLLQKIENNTVHEYVWDKEIMFEKTESRVLNYLTDELGSTIRQFEHNATCGNVTCYGPFGNVLNKKVGYQQDFCYNGFMEDIYSNTYFAQGREYMSQHGRFISEDPLPGINLYPLTCNKYIYCNDNPENITDKTGLIPIIAAAALIGGAAGLIGQGISDAVTSALDGEIKISSWQSYVGAFVGGAIGGAVALPALSCGPLAPSVIGFVSGSSSSLTTDILTNVTNGEKEDKIGSDIVFDAVASGAVAGLVSNLGEILGLDKLIKIPGITKGRGNYYAMFKGYMTRFANGNFCNLSYKTVYKMLIGKITSDTGENLMASVTDYIKGKTGAIGDLVEGKHQELVQWGANKLSEFYNAYFRQIYGTSYPGCIQ
ncbi:DUF6531 domain-containing protein [Lacrimispora sp. AGF001]|uniref:DUF6531 domain-containing protein n=1 Tax=Lacrimispora sp. AGF001 TaxID=3401631 RepID=UPI003B43D110